MTHMFCHSFTVICNFNAIVKVVALYIKTIYICIYICDVHSERYPTDFFGDQVFVTV